MKKHIWVFLCLCMAVVVCSGCVQAVDLTESEQEVIAEYAANALLEYDKGYNSKYQSDAMQEAKEKAAQVQEESKNTKTEEPQKTEAAKKTEKPATPTPELTPTMEPTPTPEPTEEPDLQIKDVTEASTDGNRLSPAEIGSLFGIEGVDVNYNGFEALDVYPTVEGNQLAFTMEASQGSKLIVAKFELVNNSEVAKTCNIVGQNIKFQMRFNNADYVAVQKTLLEDDLSLLNVILQPGESKKVVIISQVAAGYESTISSVDLIARIGGENTMFKLQ